MNPCINARDAMPQGGVMRLEARRAVAADLAGRTHADAPQVLISISDTGVGIPDDVMPRVFEPFFTTRRPGTASGLGLTTVARVANEHGGSVRLSSQPGVGTTVSILLPESTYGRESMRPQVSDPCPDAAPRSRVLLVDDERAIVRIVTRALERKGHAITPASDAREALEHFASSRPDLVVLDVNLPGMDGVACMQAMRRLAPEVPVILMSAHVDPSREQELLALGAKAFSPKPLDLAKLSLAIERALPVRLVD
jgi:CheY-like chemotaxis protein